MNDLHRLTDEIGPTYDSDTEDPAELVFPAVAQWTSWGTCLIVDRCNPRNRVMEVHSSGRVAWEFTAEPRMNWAWQLERRTTVAIHRNRILRLHRGQVDQVAELPFDCTPNCAAMIDESTLVLGTDIGIFHVTLAGDIHSHWHPQRSTFLEPSDVFPLVGGGLLVTDGTGSCVIELSPDGDRVRLYGQWKAPGRTANRLLAPTSACMTRDGVVVVADTRRHRLACYDRSGSLRDEIKVGGNHAGLFAPSYVREAADRTLTVADTGNRRIVRIDRRGRMLWSWGGSPPQGRLLSFPRSVTTHPRFGTIVCDSYNDRVVAVDGPRAIELMGPDAGLAIPRSASISPDGSELVVADGLNSRVVTMHLSTRRINAVNAVRLRTKQVPLIDPHFAQLVGNNALLMVDSDLRSVFVVKPDGELVSAWGHLAGRDDLDDPHHARLFADGSILIADSGNDRVVCFDRDGRLSWELSALPRTRNGLGPTEPVDLYFPRFVDIAPNGDLVIADSANSRIVGWNIKTGEVWSLGPTLHVSAGHLANPEVRAPRWVSWDQNGRMLVADYLNSRIAVFERFAPESPAEDVRHASA